MFDFFNNQPNPFMFMMNMMGCEDAEEGETAGAAPMPFMQQAFMMQMQFMQNMFMMPMQFMQGMAGMMNMNGAAENAAGPAAERQGTFKLGNISIPPELLRTLMQMDMSPENLEKLQSVLDFIFEMMPEPKDAGPAQEVEA